MMGEYLTLLAIGLVAGLTGGLLGIGGSVVMIPGMTLLLGPAQHLYQGAAMIVNFFVVLPAVIEHRRAQAILGPIVRVTIPAAVVGVIVGVWVSAGSWFEGIYEVRLSRLFGVFLLYVAAYNVYRLLGNRRLAAMDTQAARALPSWKIAALIGFPTGLLGGLLGIGGGTIAVPLQQVLLRVPLRRAIANSATTILPLSLIGAFYKNYCNAHVGIPFAESLSLALCLMPTAIIGGYLGGRITHIVPRRALRLAFVLLMCYAGVSLIRRCARLQRPTTAPAVPASVSQPLGKRTPPRKSCAPGPVGLRPRAGAAQIGSSVPCFSTDTAKGEGSE